MFLKIALASGAGAADYGRAADGSISFEKPYAILG
jgi:hypothetical protein